MKVASELLQVDVKRNNEPEVSQHAALNTAYWSLPHRMYRYEQRQQSRRRISYAHSAINPNYYVKECN